MEKPSLNKVQLEYRAMSGLSGKDYQPFNIKLSFGKRLTQISVCLYLREYKLRKEEKIGIHVANLPAFISNEKIREIFGQFGDIEQIVPISSGGFLRSVVVDYSDKKSVKNCLNNSNSNCNLDCSEENSISVQSTFGYCSNIRNPCRLPNYPICYRYHERGGDTHDSI